MAAVLAALLGGSGITALTAQTPAKGTAVRILGGSSLRSSAGGDRVAVTAGELRAVVDLTAPSFVRVTLDGYVAVRDVKLLRNRTRADVSASNGTALRTDASASAQSIVSLRPGTTLYPELVGASFPSGSRVSWLKVRRAFWVDVSRLQQTTVAVAKPKPAPASSAPRDPASERTSSGTAAASLSASSASSASSATPGRAAVVADSANGRLDASPAAGNLATAAGAGSAGSAGAREATGAPLQVVGGGAAALRSGPEGTVIATVSGAAALSTLERRDGWVRVRLDGWIPDTAVAVPGLADRAVISAAELRASPEAHRGRLVRWTVEVLAFQTADALREGLTRNEPYLLARGPEEERAVLYLAVPPSLLTVARTLPALARITVTARVREGRSRPSGVPVLELLDIERREGMREE